MILKGTKMMCPKCQGTEELSRNETVLCNAHIQVDEHGRWDWAGDTEVHWDTQDYRKDIQDEPEWRCGACDIFFDAPDIKGRGEGPEEDEG